MRPLVIGIALVGVLLIGCQSTQMATDEMGMGMESKGMAEKEFTVTIEVLPMSATPLAPVAWAVHTGANPFFSTDMGKRVEGLEALAEDGDPTMVDAALAKVDGVLSHGVANTPGGSGGPGPAVPGSSYSFRFKASKGAYLSFATMYVQSNDLFFSTGSKGLALFSGEAPVAGDITSKISLYDAGTEVNEEPGMGPNQAPRQGGPNMGKDEMAAVRLISEAGDGFMYPAVNKVIRVKLSAM